MYMLFIDLLFIDLFIDSMFQKYGQMICFWWFRKLQSAIGTQFQDGFGILVQILWLQEPLDVLVTVKGGHPKQDPARHMLEVCSA